MSFPRVIYTYAGTNNDYRIVRTNETTLVIEKGEKDAMGGVIWKTHMHSGTSGIGASGTAADTMALHVLQAALLSFEDADKRYL